MNEENLSGQNLLDLQAWNELTRSIIGSATDQAVMTGLLTTATDAYANLYATHQSIDENNKRLQEENEKLRKANMDLFLRVGETTQKSVGEEPRNEKTKAESITFSDLFKEVNNGNN